ncbi:MAG: glycosyltransferase [Anaerolineaceae bacterium]|nr:glycosyltransferase [Anaerolineaceae bacterium]
MNIGILLPGFSSDEHDWAIPVQLNLVREMARGDDVHVLALRYPHRQDRYRVHGAEVISLGAGQVRGLRRLRLWWDALRTLRRLHREKPFDVLHAMWADETGLIAVWAGKWLGVPVVVSIAGGELAGFTDIGYGLQRSAFSRWIVERALRADAVIPACSYTKRLIAQAGYRVPETRIRQIALGVDTARFTPGEHPARGKTLIHAASLVGVKDQAILLQAFARLDEDVSLVIVGEGPERGNLETLAAGLGITERVQFVGAVHHLDMPDYYRNAALNVLTSHHEGLGMVTLEAAACGLPTVSTAVGLLPDVPEMGVTVPVGDDAALAVAIQTLLNDEKRRTALAQSAYATIQTRFTIQHTVAHFRAFYREIM